MVNLNSLEPKDRFLTDKARDERKNVDLFEFGFQSSFCLKIFLNVMARKNISRAFVFFEARYVFVLVFYGMMDQIVFLYISI